MKSKIRIINKQNFSKHKNQNYILKVIQNIQ